MPGETEPGWAEKVARALQELYLSGVRALPEPIKRPLRQGVGRVVTNTVQPLVYQQSLGEMFSPSRLPNTIMKILADRPAYTEDDLSPHGASLTAAGRPLFREYFDLPTQDTDENIYLRDGKHFHINPGTTNEVAQETLRSFRAAEGEPPKMQYTLLGGHYFPGRPDPWDFDLHPDELERLRGKPLPVPELGRMFLEALGRPAFLESSGNPLRNPPPSEEEAIVPVTQYQEGGVVPENYDWLTRGLEREVRPEYLAQKRLNEEIAAQVEERARLERELAAQAQANNAALRGSPDLEANLSSIAQEIMRDAPNTLTPEEQQIITSLPSEQWEDSLRETIGNYQEGGIVPPFGGENMNGITMQTQPARRRIRREDMMGSGIGMARPRNTFPVPSGHPNRGISMGAPQPQSPQAQILGADWGQGWQPGPGPGVINASTAPASIPQPGAINANIAPAFVQQPGANPNQIWPAMRPPPPGRMHPGVINASTMPAYTRAPGSTDTVPAMLTPGEGVLNRGAMSMIGEGPVNALNRYGRGMEEGGIVDEEDEYPTFEESKNWTLEDWNEWRRRHPRFDPTPTPVPHYQHGTGHAGGRGGRERAVGGGGPGSRFRGIGGVEDQMGVSEWLERHDYPANWGAENRPPAGNPMPVDIPPAHDFPDLPEGGRISGGGRSWRSTLGERGGGMGLGGFGGFGSGYSGNWGRGLSSGQGGFGLGGPGQVEIGPMTGTPVPGFNWRPPLTGYLPSNPSQGMEEGGIVPGYAGGTGSVEVGGGGPHSSWGSGKPTRDWIGRIVGSASNLVFPGLGFATGPLSRWITQQIQSGKWGQQGTPSFIPSKPPQENAGAPPAVAPPISSGGRGGLGASFEQGGGIGGFQPLPGAGAGTPGMAGSLMLGQGQYWKPWLTRGYLPSNPSQGVATGGIVMGDGVVPSFQEGGTVKPIGYTDPIEEAEWQKIVQMMPPNTDIAKLREQANQSGLSAATIAKLVGSMGSQFGAGGGFSSYAAPQYSMGDLAGGGGA